MDAESFRIWAENQNVYGPVDAATVVQWIQDERVFPETFVQPRSGQHWHRAAEVRALQEHFPSMAATGGAKPDGGGSPAASDLRELSVFAGLTDEELEQIAALGQFQEAGPNELIVQQGDPSDGVYFVLEGDLRARLLVGVVDRIDKTLCRLSAGALFGELGLFLQNKRTADVLAETHCRLFCLSTNAFALLIKQIPAIASLVLFNMGKTMAQRIADDNQRYYREVTSQFLWA